jgi:hypothetical protein
MRQKRQEPQSNGHTDRSILGQVPTEDELTSMLAGLELEAARVKTLLAAVRQMSGSRQPLPEPDDLATIDETA